MRGGRPLRLLEVVIRARIDARSDGINRIAILDLPKYRETEAVSVAMGSHPRQGIRRVASRGHCASLAAFHELAERDANHDPTA